MPSRIVIALLTCLLLCLPCDASHSDPDWSPDDHQILFQANLNPTLDPAHWQIFVMNSDGGNIRQITHDAYNDQVPKWSPDGKRVLFFSDKSGRNQIYTMRLDGSEWQPV